MLIHFDKVENVVGFAADNTVKADRCKVVTTASLTSDDPRFYHYLEQITGFIFSKSLIFIDATSQFLVVIHDDLSADLYLNDFDVDMKVRVKRTMPKGEIVRGNDIADITTVHFPNVNIVPSDRIIYCFKVGWRFGLFFDLAPRESQPGQTTFSMRKLDIEEMALSIGALRRQLSFYHVYKTLESQTQFAEMMADGWFPFVEILSSEYKELSSAYESRFELQSRVDAVLDSFTEERIQRIVEKWWNVQVFAAKKPILEAGVDSYLLNTPAGFINCLKNLLTELEGILRSLYFLSTGKGDHVKVPELITYIIERAKAKAGTDSSLLLPVHFLEYLQSAPFANFSVEADDVSLSRHSSSHGIARADDYTKARALQAILTLDQVFFYL